jgi:hypothetical protein
LLYKVKNKRHKKHDEVVLPTIKSVSENQRAEGNKDEIITNEASIISSKDAIWWEKSLPQFLNFSSKESKWQLAL